MKSMNRFNDHVWIITALVFLAGCNPSPEFSTFDPVNDRAVQERLRDLDGGVGSGVLDPTTNIGGAGGSGVGATPTPSPTNTPNGGNVNYRDYTFAVSTTQNKPTIDVMFVVDDSGSMADEQQYLANGVQNLVASLKGNNVNFHIYTTSNDGTKSITTTTTTNGVQSYILKPERNTSSQAIQIRDGMSDQTITNIGNVFSQTIVSLGISGSGTEQGTCSMLRALYEQGANKIFSANTYAAFVLVSDEQDSTSLNNCYYQKTLDANNIATIWGFPGASVPNDLHKTFVEKANAMFGSTGYFYSAIIHDQIEDTALGCPVSTNSTYGTKYRDLAGQITNSNVYSICSNDYSQALTSNIGNFISNITNTTYAITLAANESIDSVYKTSGGVETQLQTPADFTVNGSNIQFVASILGANDSVRVKIKVQ